MRIFENINYDFLGKRKYFYILSGTLLLLGFINLAIRGLQFGIDFKGGTEIVLEFQKPINISNLRTYTDKMGLGNVELKTFGRETGVLVRTEMQEIPGGIFPRVTSAIEANINKILPGAPYKKVDSSANSITYQFANADTANQVINYLFNTEGFQAGKVSNELSNRQMIVRVGISDWIKDNLKQKMPDNAFKVLKEDKVGPKVGQELKTNAVLAVFFALIVILIYLGFRFKLIFAVGAVIALFHDVLITLGLYALLYNVIPGLNLEINLTIVAAFLTLIGYSNNDTVVVFDRVRETMKLHKTVDLEKNINDAINKTLSRTILTGTTTLLAVFVLLIFGGEVLRSFAFTLFFGIIIGTYSSIFVASSLVLEYSKKMKGKLEF
ncbi:MAG: protein translocase subunit SecF [Ignavibacteria bacterium]